MRVSCTTQRRTTVGTIIGLGFAQLHRFFLPGNGITENGRGVRNTRAKKQKKTRHRRTLTEQPWRDAFVLLGALQYGLR